MLIFKYYLEEFDLDTYKQMFDKIAEAASPEMVVAIPKTCDLYRLENNPKITHNEFIELFKGE